MAFDFHKDKKKYFDFQRQNAENYVIPYVELVRKIEPGTRVLEIGCAEAGVLKAFIDRGAIGLGIELVQSRIELAKSFLEEDIAQGKISFLNKNIYDIDVDKDIENRFDIIILKDVIEHIPDQERFIPQLHSFLNPGGVVFFGFPPWQMPFGGHQQISRKKYFSVLPWFHLLPMPLFKGLLKIGGEPENVITDLVEIKETGISIERFERIVHQSDFRILNRRLYLINPIYALKFGMKPRVQLPILDRVPYFRNYYTTAAFYIIGVG